MSDIGQYNADSTRIYDAARRLNEHFDSVQIFCTRTDLGGDTEHWEIGCGNAYAIYGQVRMWETNVDQLFRESASADADGALDGEEFRSG